MYSIQTIGKFRQSSREIARELGLLVDKSPYKLSLSFRHTLIELDLKGSLNQLDLTNSLQLNKSTISRIIKNLVKLGLVVTSLSKKDQRYKFISLTTTGKKIVSDIHKSSSIQVCDALEQLSKSQQSLVIQGINLYAEALKKSRAQKNKSNNELRK